MMEDAEADDAGRQRRPGVPDRPQPVVSHPHPTQAHCTQLREPLCFFEVESWIKFAGNLSQVD